MSNRRKIGCSLVLISSTIVWCSCWFMLSLSSTPMPDGLFRSHVEVYPNSIYIRELKYYYGTSTGYWVRYYWTTDAISQVKGFYDIDQNSESTTLYPNNNLVETLLYHFCNGKRESCRYYYDFELRLVPLENQELYSLPVVYMSRINPSLFTLSEPLSGGVLIAYYYDGLGG
jgi:hypothetical protein